MFEVDVSLLKQSITIIGDDQTVITVLANTGGFNFHPKTVCNTLHNEYFNGSVF